MNIHELDSYDLGDAVKFNDRLNPRIWGADEKMRPEVREQLLQIADDFREFLGIDVEVKDITVSGSNAAYTYTPHSDIDLHLVVDLPRADESEVYRELFDAKKYAYNDQHNIKIGGYDVELYVQDARKPHHSQGIYSVMNNDWVSVPRRRRPDIDDISVKSKFEDLGHRIEDAVSSGDYKKISALAQRIKDLRQAGLDAHGEFGPENLAFKILRTQGLIKKLFDARNAAKDRLLSLDERKKKKRKKSVKYGFGGYWYPGFGYAGQDTPAAQASDGGGDGGGESVQESQRPTVQETVTDFVNFCADQLELEHAPRIKFRRDPAWSARNKTFGRYNHDTNELEVSLAERHVMDILRTVAHELTHQRQHETDEVPNDAGTTGSSWENEANAAAGILMRSYAEQHPEFFVPGAIEESASGYIPTKAQAKDPRFSMALTADIKPGQVGKEANKLKLKTDRQGHPQIARANGLFENLMQEYKQYKAAEDYSPNKPPGPESKPTMPSGTLRVDVSDMYDWYKLGQHISNMKGLGKHDFGAGPPSSIISFGDENTEHKFIDQIKATGLDVTDIDPADPKKRPGKTIKTDPTYNVDEAIQAPVSKEQRAADDYYRFIVGKIRLGRVLNRQEQEFFKTYNLKKKLAEFAPSPDRDDDGEGSDYLTQLANRWWNAADPRDQQRIADVIRTFGYEIAQVESEDDAVQLTDIKGNTDPIFISADEFDPDLYEADEKRRRFLGALARGVGLGAVGVIGAKYGLKNKEHDPDVIFAQRIPDDRDREKFMRLLKQREGYKAQQMVGDTTATTALVINSMAIKKYKKQMAEKYNLQDEIKEQAVAEGIKQDYLWHGSTQKIPALTPRQAHDTGGAAGSNQNAIYATADKNTAIKMGMAERGSDTAMFDQADQLVLFSGRLRHGKNVYLHQLPRYDANGQDMWLPGGNGNEFYTKPDVKEIKPLRIIHVPVDGHLDLVCKPTAKDLKLRQSYLHKARLKQRGITEGADEEAWELVGQPVPEIQQLVKKLGLTNDETGVARIVPVIKATPDTQLPAASIPKLKNLANKPGDPAILKAIQKISGRADAAEQYATIMARRDAGEGRDRGYTVGNLIAAVKSGNYESPVLLKLPTGVYVIGGRTRLYAALALNTPIRVKILTPDSFAKQTVKEDEDLDEVKMSPGALEKFATSDAAKGIRAGFEAELIFRDTQGEADELDPEPNYDADERAYSIQQVIDFFDNDDYGFGMNDRQRNQLEEALDERYMEWRDEQITADFRNDAEDLIREKLLEETPMDQRIHFYLTDSLQMSDEEADAVIKAGAEAPRFTNSTAQKDYADENPEYKAYLEAADEAEQELEESVEFSVNRQDEYWDEALDEYRDTYMGDDDSFFSDIGLRWMSDIANEFNLDWPVWDGGEQQNYGNRNWEDIGNSLQQVIDMPVVVSSNYHSTRRRPGQWIIEPDGSLDPDDKSEEAGLEIVSPPMPLLTAIEKLKQVVDWANDPNGGNAYTNSSTGLHMGVSLPTMAAEAVPNDPGIDYVKLILFLGDKYVLQQFGREANTYTASALDKLKQNIKGKKSDPAGVIKLLQHGLTELAHKELQKGVGTSKYTSAHIQPGYIEFRSPGGDWLAKSDEEIGVLENTMMRFARAMQIAGDPNAERQEYAKKLYKLVTTDNEQYADQLRLFSEFSAGTINKEQLKKQWADTVLQKELPSVGKEEYEVYRRDNGNSPDATVGTLYARDYDDAYDQFLRQYGRDINNLDVRIKQPWFDVFGPDGERVTTFRAKDIDKAEEKARYDFEYWDDTWKIYRRPDDTPEPKASPRAQVAKRIATKPRTPTQYNYDIIDQRTLDLKAIDRFYAANDQEASRVFDQWLKMKNLPNDTANYGYRRSAASKEAEPNVAQNFEPQQSNWEIYQSDDPSRVVNTLIDATERQVQDWLRRQETQGMPPGFLSARRQPTTESFRSSIGQAISRVEENFADGKVKGKSSPGRVKRAGASCKGSVTDLRARAKKYSGEKAKMYHWCANMKSGRNKK